MDKDKVGRVVGLRPRGTLRLCGYCQSWNSRPCGEQCVLQPTDPTWEDLTRDSTGQSSDTLARPTLAADFDFPGGQESARQALTLCHRVFGFDLERFVTWGEDWNQAVRDAYEQVCVAMGHEPMPIHGQPLHIAQSNPGDAS